MQPSSSFRVLVLAPLAPNLEPSKSPVPVAIERMDIGEVMDRLAPKLQLRSTVGSDSISITLEPRTLKDFNPDQIVRSIPALTGIQKARDLYRESRKEGMSESEIRARLDAWPNLPPLQWPEKPPPREDTDVSESSDPLSNLLNMVAMPSEPSSKTTTATYRSIDDQLQTLISEAIEGIIDDEGLKSLEAAWRGLDLLIRSARGQDNLEIEVLPITSESLDGIIADITPSLIERLPQLILIDTPFENIAPHLDTLNQIATLSETLMVPTVIWTPSRFFGLDSWQALNTLPYIPHLLDEPRFAKWQALRRTDASHWLCASCNRFLIRHRYGPDNPIRTAPIREKTPLWISPVWAIGGLIIKSISQAGWPTRFTDHQTIFLEDLALEPTPRDDRLPTEAEISENRLHQLVKAGFVPLIAFRNRDIAFCPAETTLAGGSLNRQMLMTLTIQSLLSCRESSSPNLHPTEVERLIEQTLLDGFTHHGDPTPRIRVVSKASETGEPMTVHITLHLSRAILPDGRPIELGFGW